MVRNMDLVRDLLLKIEADPKYDGTREFYFDTTEELGITNHSLEEVSYHLKLLIEERYIKPANISGRLPGFTRLTSHGHDFIDNIRDPGVWKKVKARTGRLQAVSLTIVYKIAESEVLRLVGLESPHSIITWIRLTISSLFSRFHR